MRFKTKDKKEWLKTIKFTREYFGKGNFADNLSVIIDYLNEIEQVKIKEKRKIMLLCDLAVLYSSPEEVSEKYKQYKTEKSQRVKVLIRYGDEALLDYNTRLAGRPPVKNVKSLMTKKYWIEKGFNEEEAKLKITETARSYLSKRYANPKNSRIGWSPVHIEYWTNKGYTEQESETLRRPFITSTNGSLETYIKRYGDTLGIIKLNERNDKRKAKLLYRYGTTVLNGCVSKESLRVFLKLYKNIRKLGIQRSDIYWGIKGSREYAQHYKGSNYFYDFVIKSLKICIEYNNTFWHPRENTEWNGFIDYDEAKTKDKLKKEIIISSGFKYYVIWNDDNHKDLIERLTIIINEEISRR